MPQLGETVSEGTVTRWLRSQGDSVAADEPLLEIATDKVSMEVPCLQRGVLLEILVREGETVRVGAALAWLEVEGEDIGEAPAAGGVGPGPGAGRCPPRTPRRPRARIAPTPTRIQVQARSLWSCPSAVTHVTPEWAKKAEARASFRS